MALPVPLYLSYMSALREIPLIGNFNCCSCCLARSSVPVSGLQRCGLLPVSDRGGLSAQVCSVSTIKSLFLSSP